MSILDWIFGAREVPVPAPEPAPEPAEVPATGVLFGLDPPEEHYFDVSASSGAWHVWIVPNGKAPHDRVATGCALLRGYTDRACIRAAGVEALDRYSRIHLVESLSGAYPPKRTA